MPDRNCAAVHVEEFIGDAEFVAAINHLASEGLVQLPESDVFHLETVALEQLGHCEYRSDSHLVGLASGDCDAAINSERMQPALFGLLRFHQNAYGRAVGKLARVTGRDEFAGSHNGR